MSTARVRRLDASGDVTFGQGTANYAGGSEGTAQRVRCRLRTFRGEYFLDATAGVPWFASSDGTLPIMGVARNLQYAEAVLKKTILGTDGIASISRFSVAFNSQTRKLTISVTVVSVDGDVINIVEVGP